MKEIRDRVKLRDVLSLYGITAKGRKALCPFHQEKTPSFSFNDQYWNCFGCGKKGDAIAFVQTIEAITVYEAYVKLCEQFGIPVKKRNSRKSTYYESVMENYDAFKRMFKEDLEKARSIHHDLWQNQDLFHHYKSASKLYTKMYVALERCIKLEGKLNELEDVRYKSIRRD